MGRNIEKNLNPKEKEEFESFKSWIDPNLVSIWEIKDGYLTSIKNKDTGTVHKHYFNKIMNKIMNEYYEMLNFYNL